MKLIDEWRKAWRMLCMQSMTAAVALQGAWLEAPADMKAQVPAEYVHYLTIALIALGMLGRMVKQESVSGK
jgi:hypothetical protein